MEFGPRSLGARSILGDPRSASMQKNLNLKVKYRESFRPFAPSVLRENVSDWFELDSDSPYMLLVAGVRKDRCRSMTPQEQALFGIDKLNIARSEIPAVTHVDYSALAFKRCTPTLIRYSIGCSHASRRKPAARCWSTLASTYAESRLSVLQKMRSAVSWETS